MFVSGEPFHSCQSIIWTCEVQWCIWVAQMSDKAVGRNVWNDNECPVFPAIIFRGRHNNLQKPRRDAEIKPNEWAELPNLNHCLTDMKDNHFLELNRKFRSFCSFASDTTTIGKDQNRAEHDRAECPVLCGCKTQNRTLRQLWAVLVKQKPIDILLLMYFNLIANIHLKCTFFSHYMVKQEHLEAKHHKFHSNELDKDSLQYLHALLIQHTIAAKRSPKKTSDLRVIMIWTKSDNVCRTKLQNVLQWNNSSRHMLTLF